MFGRYLALILLIASASSIYPFVLGSDRIYQTTVTSSEVITSQAVQTLTQQKTMTHESLQIELNQTKGLVNPNLFVGYATYCQYDAVAFQAKSGQRLSLKFSSSLPIDLYFLNESEFTIWLHAGITTKPCETSGIVTPIMEQKAATNYDGNVAIPRDGSYELLFIDLKNGDAHVSLDYALYSVAVVTSISSITTTRAISITSLVTAATPLTTSLPLGTVGLLAAAAVAVLSAILVVRRRGQTPKKKAPASQQVLVETPVAPPSPPQKELPPETKSVMSTGYAGLDELLNGGIPEGFAVLILSASWDETDLIVRKTVDSASRTGRPVFYISNDINAIEELLQVHGHGFYAFSSLATKMKGVYQNLFSLPDIGNLSEFSISLSTYIKEAQAGSDVGKLLVLDVISDVLLRHKSSITLRWLSDFLAKRKLDGFTTLGILSPLIASREETQPIIDVFDGVIEIYERTLGDRAKRFAVIKKMRGRRYIDKDLMLDRDQLF